MTEQYPRPGWGIRHPELTTLLDCPGPSDPFPHPDFLQHVYAGRADENRTREPDWSDTEGYELSSSLMSIDDAVEKCSYDPLASAFLALLAR
ncbi:MAG TPA: hypothetical protein VMY88_05940 [Acidimicrobiales bacterium]|nr:hypothetical protein [Acidimicrobiales bacterium]